MHFSSTSAFIEPTTDHLQTCAPMNTRKRQKPVTFLADSAYNPAHVGYLSTMYTMVPITFVAAFFPTLLSMGLTLETVLSTDNYTVVELSSIV